MASTDALLLREVDAALRGEDDGDPAAGADGSGAEMETQDSGSDDDGDGEADCLTPLDDISQYAQRSPPTSQELRGRSSGAIVTSSGVFDASFANDVCSDGEEVRDTPEAVDHGTLPPGADADEDTPSITNRSRRLGGERDAAAEATSAPASDDIPRGVGGARPAAVTPLGSARGSGITTTTTSSGSSSAKAKAAGRPRGGRKSPTLVRPTYASPDGRPLARDLARAEEDTQEVLRNQKKTTSSNRLGGGDLRVLRDNMDELTGKSPSSGSKRDASDISGTGATYASNKRARAKKRLDQLRKEMDEAEEKQSTGAVDMMQMLVFMREDADRRSETEDRRRREDREARLAAERQEREDRENLRRDESATAEARRSQELELARAIREEQARKEAALAAESRLRYEDRLERDRTEARERHEQMLLLISAMQRGNNQPN
jgi:hypothetical protein